MTTTPLLPFSRHKLKLRTCLGDQNTKKKKNAKPHPRSFFLPTVQSIRKHGNIKPMKKKFESHIWRISFFSKWFHSEKDKEWEVKHDFLQLLINSLGWKIYTNFGNINIKHNCYRTKPARYEFQLMHGRL